MTGFYLENLQPVLLRRYLAYSCLLQTGRMAKVQRKFRVMLLTRHYVISKMVGRLYPAGRFPLAADHKKRTVLVRRRYVQDVSTMVKFSLI
jgi:hypothetical protein